MSEDKLKQLLEAVNAGNPGLLEGLEEQAEQVAALKNEPGYHIVHNAISAYYQAVPTLCLESEEDDKKYWRGVRFGITLFERLVGDEVKRVSEIERIRLQLEEEDDDTEPGADFMQLTKLGGSTL